MLLSCLCLLPAQFASAQTVVKSISMETPRAYGYVIGDVVRIQADIDIEKNYRLDGSALPKSGLIKRWLSLRQIRTKVEEGSSVDRYRIELDYQIFYAPLTVRNLTIPALDVTFSGAAGNEAHATLPAWDFSISPLHEHDITGASGLPEPRTDAEPGPAQTATDWLLFWLGAVTALIAMGYLAYIRIVLIFWMSGKHFADAGKALRRMEASPMSDPQMRAAFVCVHQAFNISNQGPLFVEGLDEFFTRNMRFLPLRQDIVAFYQASYSLFFGDDAQRAATFPLGRMLKLCRDCLRIERERR
ncbi:hypothetical protein RP726_18030 [Candidatus Methylospira mobilis]|uniref:hypothetical protein n=1 Tax=Candidatus Methylospira mobilis TaxID=1808979 RepID=UPI0028E77DB7|nr:hypothetical protein [Candidatus Methylospira mobilis]WNV04284.1 hypothetical protein RP726_18030 [Candidatus Methylospira mobilis]